MSKIAEPYVQWQENRPPRRGGAGIAVTIAAIVVAVVVGWIGLRTWYVDTHCTMILGTQVCESSSGGSGSTPAQGQRAAPSQPSLQAVPASQSTLPPGVSRIGSHEYLVNCFKAQCTTLPGAGPDGTTCTRPSTGEQTCW